jgi:hypothetical protein
MPNTYHPPIANEKAFNCPYCSAFAQQIWYKMRGIIPGGLSADFDVFGISRCTRCDTIALWRGSEMAYPHLVTAPPPHDDMPADVRRDFEEARQVADKSPRSAAALLRLAVQRLMVHLGEPGQHLNKDIGSLVTKGLPPQIQQSCDIVRVLGNESVHPGDIDLTDSPEDAKRLFDLVNIIVQVMISQPKQIAEACVGAASIPPVFPVAVCQSMPLVRQLLPRPSLGFPYHDGRSSI